MLPEIKLIYHGLEIQIRAGVYVTDALTECYAGVQEMRLKQALLDLAGAVTMKADVYDALEHFQSRFDNRYIDALCITLLQAMESGQAVELLADIAEQVKDMEVSVMGRRKGALDRSVTFYQLGILAAVLGMVLYACIEQMFTAALGF
jgi:type II secretory pathway component PulF